MNYFDIVLYYSLIYKNDRNIPAPVSCISSLLTKLQSPLSVILLSIIRFFIFSSKHFCYIFSEGTFLEEEEEERI
jgi:hypothetical protein